MASVRAYSGLDLQGGRVSNVGAPMEPGDAAPLAVVQTEVSAAREEATSNVQGLRGALERGEVTPGNGVVHVGPARPSDVPPGVPYVWVQTGLGPTGADTTLWLEDGS